MPTSFIENIITMLYHRHLHYIIIAQEIFSWYASAPWSTTDLRTFKLGIDVWGLQCLSACFTAGTKESKTVVTKKKRFLDLKSKLEFLDYVVAINYVQRQPLLSFSKNYFKQVKRNQRWIHVSLTNPLDPLISKAQSTEPWTRNIIFLAI